ncbi:MAG: hypothetical protein AB7K24_00450, partial [Gemmataceae bacterium]
AKAEALADKSAELHRHLQQSNLAELESKVSLDGSWPWLTLLNSFARMEDERRASLACARAALAVERYRLEYNKWPGSLDQLVPDFLAAIPTDPQGRPLRYRRLDDGVIVFAKWDWKKVDGEIEHRWTKWPVRPAAADGIDPGAPQFRLWDPRRRRPDFKQPFRADVDLERTVDRIYREVMGREPPR